jgi:hypothetical protein
MVVGQPRGRPHGTKGGIRGLPVTFIFSLNSSAYSKVLSVAPVKPLTKTRVIDLTIYTCRYYWTNQGVTNEHVLQNVDSDS